MTGSATFNVKSDDIDAHGLQKYQEALCLRQLNPSLRFLGQTYLRTISRDQTSVCSSSTVTFPDNPRPGCSIFRGEKIEQIVTYYNSMASMILEMLIRYSANNIGNKSQPARQPHIAANRHHHALERASGFLDASRCHRRTQIL
jgi:hypothetical protein